MYTVKRLFMIGLLAMMIAGCGASKVTVRPDATSNIHTIALITIDEPKAYVAQDFGNPGMMFGAVGGAVAAGVVLLDGALDDAELGPEFWSGTALLSGGAGAVSAPAQAGKRARRASSRAWVRVTAAPAQEPSRLISWASSRSTHRHRSQTNHPINVSPARCNCIPMS